GRATRRTPRVRCGSSAWTTRRAPRWRRSTATASSGWAPTPTWCSWRRCACRWSGIRVTSSTFDGPVPGAEENGHAYCHRPLFDGAVREQRSGIGAIAVAVAVAVAIWRPRGAALVAGTGASPGPDDSPAADDSG